MKITKLCFFFVFFVEITYKICQCRIIVLLQSASQ